MNAESSFLLAYLWPWAHRDLILQFAVREVSLRYRGSLGGLAWAFVTPLLLLGVYTYIFHNVFHARWPNAGDSTFDFAIRLYAGLIVFNSVAEYLQRAPRLVLDQPNLVKRVVFPLEILPWTALGSSLFHLLTASLVLLGAVMAAQGSLSFSLLAVPLVWLAMVPFMLAMGWLFSALGVYFRDVSQVMGMAVTFLQFLSPVFYPADALPGPLHAVLLLNPLTLAIEETRRVIIEGAWPHWDALAAYAATGVAAAWLGARFFRAVRQGFADVL